MALETTNGPFSNGLSVLPHWRDQKWRKRMGIEHALRTLGTTRFLVKAARNAAQLAYETT
ncbi:MAG: hypothetical protein HQ581_08665 [Planctomycetes bacterium]|nr:hypothetical protein [Planctomycetota bacterium]